MWPPQVLRCNTGSAVRAFFSRQISAIHGQPLMGRHLKHFLRKGGCPGKVEASDSFWHRWCVKLKPRINFDTGCVSKSLSLLLCKMLLTQHLCQNESEESTGTLLEVSHSTSPGDYFLAWLRSPERNYAYIRQSFLITLCLTHSRVIIENAARYWHFCPAF